MVKNGKVYKGEVSIDSILEKLESLTQEEQGVSEEYLQLLVDYLTCQKEVFSGGDCENQQIMRYLGSLDRYRRWYKKEVSASVKEHCYAPKVKDRLTNHHGRLTKRISELLGDFMVLPIVEEEVTDCVIVGDKVVRPYVVMPDGKKIKLYPDGK
jgi:hypothetical protein